MLERGRIAKQKGQTYPDCFEGAKDINLWDSVIRRGEHFSVHIQAQIDRLNNVSVDFHASVD